MVLPHLQKVGCGDPSAASEASLTLGCSIEISRDIYIVVGLSVIICQINCVGAITWTTRMLKVFWGRLNQIHRVIHCLYARALAWTEKKLKKIVHLEMRNLKLTELQRLKNRGKKVRIRLEKDRARRRTKGKKRSPDTDDYEKQRLATLKRLKRGEVDLRLEKVVASKQLRLAVETEEEKRTRLEAFLKSWQLCLSFKLDVLTT